MNVKSCLKVNKGFPHRTVSLKLEEVKVIYHYWGRRCGAAVARRLLRGESCVYALPSLVR
jgi:hypothetical protein